MAALRYGCFAVRFEPLGESLLEALVRAFAVFSILIVLGVAAYASETITYVYDARGRVIRVLHSGTVNNNVVTNYSYDKADNRTNKATSGAP